ncbi:ABC transporter permease [Halothiobacillus neapolitanus]|uniref:Inner-membrane translocator n=1 Tax=Halothiobacillus neapolitanus (strain ATCC 23641 / DSM 15147 / CIP 104769 / NCIMB 8539 / c2) TaxID=555778 RepID=D0KZ23_HALNC|nr:ABC transporter permease [Halothiobacillus neapolitanus]ACX95696.1 inner-membrane translocator [Halothiobacillus neapolitanus c2]TDN66002.1 nucleoside ABC transporter membrane protein [Halothiobacillus neapolitanus]
MTEVTESLGCWGVPIAVIAGAIRASTPFLLVSLGECVTEKSGRINLGLEGVLIMGAMAGYGASLYTGSAWLGVLAAGFVGAIMGLLHGILCSLKRVNDIAIGISFMLLGTGLAFFLGKPLIQPQAPTLPSIPLGFWSDSAQIQSALQINPLFLVGIVLAILLHYAFLRTRWGLQIRIVGDSEDAARAMGFRVIPTRILATVFGGFLAGVGGSFLSLYYPGSWSEGLSSGQGIMAVALVIFARWEPLRCLWASLLFGAAGALGPALQAMGLTSGFYLLNALPYVLTLGILVLTTSPGRKISGAPGELSLVR